MLRAFKRGEIGECYCKILQWITPQYLLIILSMEKIPKKHVFQNRNLIFHGITEENRNQIRTDSMMTGTMFTSLRITNITWEL